MESINGGVIIVITTPGEWSLHNEFTCHEYTCGNKYDGPCMGQWEWSVVMGCDD
ncbi:MAG: hypothetical protein GY950_18060 [bacterium]|nr:hypothetical protein [bacterium]